MISVTSCVIIAGFLILFLFAVSTPVACPPFTVAVTNEGEYPFLMLIHHGKGCSLSDVEIVIQEIDLLVDEALQEVREVMGCNNYAPHQ